MVWIVLALVLFVIQIAVIIANEYCRPSKAVAWIVILYIVPIIGFVFYYFIGKEYSCIRPRHESDNAILEQMKDTLIERCRRRIPQQSAERILQEDDTLHAMLKHVVSIPVTACNQTTVYAEGNHAFEAMLNSIDGAKHHIHIEFYIIRHDELGTRFQETLIRKAREGVEVRFIYDGIGSRRLNQKYLKQLREAGVETGCFFPPIAAFINRRLNYRNHRKIVVVDGEVGYIGGFNIGDEYLGKDPKIGFWRDTHFKINGDAVWWIQYTFLTDWYFVKGELLTHSVYYPERVCQGEEFVQIIKSGPDETLLELVFACVVSARRRIYIETPYFVPEPCVLMALKTAAASGVDIRIIIPAFPDSRLVYYASLSYVQELQRAGVRFYCYENGFIHAKVVIVDELALSGSANMDMRSFNGQFEIDAVFYDGNVVNRLVEDFNRDLQQSMELVPEPFEKRSILQKLIEGFARLLAPLF